MYLYSDDIFRGINCLQLVEYNIFHHSSPLEILFQVTWIDSTNYNFTALLALIKNERKLRCCLQLPIKHFHLSTYTLQRSDWQPLGKPVYCTDYDIPLPILFCCQLSLQIIFLCPPDLYIFQFIIIYSHFYSAISGILSPLPLVHRLSIPSSSW